MAMQIVPTEYRYISKEVLPTNQFSVTEYYSPMKDFDRSWPGRFVRNHLTLSLKLCSLVQLLTLFILYVAVYFLYDLSPITVTIREERRSFLHFITRLCAVLGGTFALTGWWDIKLILDHLQRLLFRQNKQNPLLHFSL